MTDTKLRAGIVARVSASNARSVDEQDVACRADCEEHGWQVDPDDFYGHTGSASDFAVRGRPEWDRFMRNLKRLGIAVMWEPSRGARNMGEWNAFVSKCADHGILIWFHTHHRTYDPRIARDWKSLME